MAASKLFYPPTLFENVLIIRVLNRRLNSDKTIFLPLLERLAKCDETVVREQAIKSLTEISNALSDQEMQNVFCPLVIRLAQAEFFTGRVSSCGLFFHAYPRSNA